MIAIAIFQITQFLPALRFKNKDAKSMDFALCHLSVVPLRSSPSDKSEQISQLLFGEIVEQLEWKGRSWVKVRCTWDNCIGWAQARQVKPLTVSEYRLFSEKFAYCLDLFQPLMSNDFAMPIPLGASIPNLCVVDHRLFQAEKGRESSAFDVAVREETRHGRLSEVLSNHNF